MALYFLSVKCRQCTQCAVRRNIIWRNQLQTKHDNLHLKHCSKQNAVGRQCVLQKAGKKI